MTNDEEVTINHKLLFTFTPDTFSDVEEEMIVESRLHARKASMAMDYQGPLANIQPALDLFYEVGLDGRDDLTVTPINTDAPVDLSFSSTKIQKINAYCTRFPSSVKSSWC